MSSKNSLWCPNCDILGKVKLMPNFEPYSDARSFTALCAACGYSIQDLGSDGTRRKAVDEWQSICEHAMQVKKQLLGESSVKNVQLELDVNVPMLTDWKSGAKETPTIEGWYDVQFRNPPAEVPRIRRYWKNMTDFSTAGFSRPVFVGEKYTPEELEQIKNRPSHYEVDKFEWRGLAQPASDQTLEPVKVTRERKKINL